MAVLEVSGVSVRFGGVTALRDVSLQAGEWEIVGIIGPNGAGKTTLFNCITGVLQPATGAIRYRRRAINHLPMHARAALGIGRTFQQVGLVKGATVLRNLLTAQHLETGYDPWTGMAGIPDTFGAERRLTQRAHRLLSVLGLEPLAHTVVADLPYGMLKRVEIGAVLATDPDLLLLDEPGSGMGPEEAHELGDTLLALRRQFGLTVVMIDHHVPLVTQVSDYVYCLNVGEVLAEGPPDVVRRHPEVVKAYLGEQPQDETSWPTKEHA